MGLIRYDVKSGTLPVTVQLIGSGLGPVLHNVYEQGQFTVPEGTYTLRVSDADGCVVNHNIDFCDDCPDGYESINEGCVKYEQQPAGLTLPLKQIFKKSYAAYSNFGTLIFDNGWNYNGTGSYQKIDVSNTYWINTNPISSAKGPMNRNAIWAEEILYPQDIGFSFCIDLLVEKTYYIGVGCDNWSKIKLNGQWILDQGHKGGTLSNAISDLKAMLNADDQVTFKYWFIYPVTMKAGRNIIEVQGHNYSLPVAAFGMEIYDATKADLINATSDADLQNNFVWRSKDMVNQYLNYTYSSEDGFRGYNCPEDYALVTCENEVYCEKRIFIEC